jgi:hypothetical protein
VQPDGAKFPQASGKTPQECEGDWPAPGFRPVPSVLVLPGSHGGTAGGWHLTDAPGPPTIPPPPQPPWKVAYA